ncbi:MAG: transporter substrate-binding domain-containing protein [Bacteroidota bacterium]
MKFRLIFISLLFSMLFILSCKEKKQNSVIYPLIDIAQIKERGTIVACMSHSTTNYFIYKGRPMGFHYELMKNFANFLGVKLEVIVYKDIADAYKNLATGKCDIIADNLTVSDFRERFVSFSTPLTKTQQVLVQRNPKGWQFMSNVWRESFLVRNTSNLENKIIYIPNKSVYKNTLTQISKLFKARIIVLETPKITTEQLIRKVANCEIDYTVSDKNIANISKQLYPHLDVDFSLTDNENISWAMRKESPNLLKLLNSWISEIRHTYFYKFLYYKYFNSKWIIIASQKNYNSINSSKISNYDEIIKKNAIELKWDWMLLASLMYQESQFRNDTVSKRGAFGIMQMMPETAKRFGVDSSSSVTQNIKAGALYLKRIDESLKKSVPDSLERAKFVLASYNIGFGHIVDAIKLTKKYGGNARLWDKNVAVYLKKKSESKYYNDPLVKNGPCKGHETTRLVSDVMERFMHYKNLITDTVKMEKTIKISN